MRNEELTPRRCPEYVMRLHIITFNAVMMRQRCTTTMTLQLGTCKLEKKAGNVGTRQRECRYLGRNVWQL